MKEFDALVKKIKTYNPGADTGIVKKAFDFARHAHKEHKRLSGDPYITHPLAVAMVLADLEQDVLTISAALLHDVIEDAEVSHDELAKKYGSEIDQIPLGAIGVYSFVQKLKVGLQQLMAGSRNFRVSTISRSDVMALTEEASNVSGIPYIMEAYREEAESILNGSKQPAAT